MIHRLIWVVATAIWLLVVLSLASFNSADWPSHAVAVHNEPPANLCGAFGAALSYWSYHVIGIGVWLFVVAWALALAVAVAGRTIDQPGLRLIGIGIVATGISSLHALFAPTTGPLPGAHAGLLASTIIAELTPRFATVGTFLLLLTSILVGAVVAADTIVMSIMRWSQRLADGAQRSVQATLEALRARATREPAVATAPGKTSRRRRSTRALDAPIDESAGGLGATESFDPDEYAEPEIDDEDDDAEEYEEYDEADEYDEVDEEWEEDEPEDLDEEEPDSRRPLTSEELRAKIAKLPVMIGSSKRDVARDEDIPREESFENYRFPTLDLLADPESDFSEKIEEIVRSQAEALEHALQTYGIGGEVAGIEPGPTVTLFAIELAPGTKVSKLQAVSSDLARSLRAENVRIVPNMVGRTTVGIEVPNSKREKVRLKELMSGGHAKGMTLPMFLGKDASGDPLVADLTRMPHMLIAGTTGSGKSVCLNSILVSWLYTKRPNELKLVLVDPKMVELNQFANIPHLMCPVVTEMPRAAAILEWAVTKMEERYELLKEAGVQNIGAYNKLEEDELDERFGATTDLERARVPKRLPYMVFVIDELADLMMTTKEVEQSIVRIAQKARAVGIHLILATQRPQANVVTGLIKSNMPCRVSFKVASGMDSRIVLDQKGAELLLGAGDMMFLTPQSSQIQRAQNVLVDDAEIRQVVKFVRDVAAPSFERSLISIRPGEEDGLGLDAKERDPLFDKAVEIMIETGRGSVSLLQRRLAIGYSRASRLVDQMGQAGILGEHKGSVAREVLITLDEWRQIRAMEAADAEDEAAGAPSEAALAAMAARGTAPVADTESGDGPLIETSLRSNGTPPAMTDLDDVSGPDDPAPFEPNLDPVVELAPAEEEAADSVVEEADEDEEHEWIEGEEEAEEPVDVAEGEDGEEYEDDEADEEYEYEYEYEDADADAEEDGEGEDDEEYEYEYVYVDEDEDDAAEASDDERG